jgi:hypothetical protein
MAPDIFTFFMKCLCKTNMDFSNYKQHNWILPLHELASRIPVGLELQIY